MIYGHKCCAILVCKLASEMSSEIKEREYYEIYISARNDIYCRAPQHSEIEHI